MIGAVFHHMVLGTWLIAQPVEPAPAEDAVVPASAEPAPAEPAGPATAEPAPATVAPLPAPFVAPLPAPFVAPPPEAPAAAPAPKSRFVFSFLPALTFGINRIPSGDLPFFFGGRLKRGKWALGYQLTLSMGGAERYFIGFFTHRHHLTGMTSFGRRERGFASIGGGVALLLAIPVVEAETRIGYRFGASRRGIVGTVIRLGWNVGERERVPLPQVGAFIGVSML